MIDKLSMLDGKTIKSIMLCSGDDVEGEEYGRYKIVIETKHRLIEIHGCHDQGPDVRILR